MPRTEDRCECKVCRGLEECGLDDLNEALRARRTGEESRPASLRDLVDYFNREVLRTALEDAGETPLDGEVENTYRLLTDDDVNSGTRFRVRKRLEREDVDPDAVEERFVSHPTMGRHLEDCLGVEKPGTTGKRVETATERIFKMRSRTEAVIETTLDGLASGDRIAAGELAVTVDVQVTCEECGTYEEVGAFVDRGGCDCDPE